MSDRFSTGNRGWRHLVRWELSKEEAFNATAVSTAVAERILGYVGDNSDISTERVDIEIRHDVDVYGDRRITGELVVLFAALPYAPVEAGTDE